MLPVAAKLQEECDRQAKAILSQWEEERRPSRRIQETQRYRYPHLAALAALPQTAQPAGVAALKRPYQQLSRQGTQTTLAPAAAEEEAVDPRDIDALLTELSQISGRWQLYRRFLYGRLSVSNTRAFPPLRTLHLHTLSSNSNAHLMTTNSIEKQQRHARLSDFTVDESSL